MHIQTILGRKTSLLFMLALATVATGCVNMSTLQTARTVPVGEYELISGGGYYLSPILSEVSASTENSENEVKLVGVPYLEIGGRVGMVDYLDLGLKITIPGTIALDVKYQFLDLDGFAMAVGGGIGYLHYETTSHDTKFTNEIIDLMLPLFISYHFNEAFAVYGSPKYVMRVHLTGDADPSQLLGAGGGFRIGEEVGIYIEATYMVDLANPDFTMIQATGASFF